MEPSAPNTAAPASPPPPPEVLEIAVPLPCVNCGYNLIRVAIARACPECGQPAAKSLQSFFSALPEDLHRLRFGARCIALSPIIVPIGCVLTALILLQGSSGTVGMITPLLLTIAGPILSALGWKAICRRSVAYRLPDQPIPAEQRGADRARQVAWVLAAACAFAYAATLASGCISQLVADEDRLSLALVITGVLGAATLLLWTANGIAGLAVVAGFATQSGWRQLAPMCRCGVVWNWLNVLAVLILLVCVRDADDPFDPMLLIPELSLLGALVWQMLVMILFAHRIGKTLTVVEAHPGPVVRPRATPP